MRWFVAALALLALFGCAAAAGPEKPLPRSKVMIETAHGRVAFAVEVAADPVSQERGLMYRTALAPDAGMLFDFHRPAMTRFWMKNTVLPLDIIFIRADGTISTIAANAVPYSEALIPSAEPIRAVLEINGGRSAALGIAPGDRVLSPIFGRAGGSS